MLRDIKQYIKTNRRVSLRDISLHFQVDPNALQPMLDLLMKKGTIRCIKNDNCASCGDCTVAGCDKTTMLIYEIVEE